MKFANIYRFLPEYSWSFKFNIDTKIREWSMIELAIKTIILMRKRICLKLNNATSNPWRVHKLNYNIPFIAQISHRFTRINYNSNFIMLQRCLNNFLFILKNFFLYFRRGLPWIISSNIKSLNPIFHYVVITTCFQCDFSLLFLKYRHNFSKHYN